MKPRRRNNSEEILRLTSGPVVWNHSLQHNKCRYRAKQKQNGAAINVIQNPWSLGGLFPFVKSA